MDVTQTRLEEALMKVQSQYLREKEMRVSMVEKSLVKKKNSFQNLYSGKYTVYTGQWHQFEHPECLLKSLMHRKRGHSVLETRIKRSRQNSSSV